jgi:hypothetical protein
VNKINSQGNILILSILFFVFGLTSCDKNLSRTPHPKPVKLPTYQELAAVVLSSPTWIEETVTVIEEKKEIITSSLLNTDDMLSAGSTQEEEEEEQKEDFHPFVVVDVSKSPVIPIEQQEKIDEEPAEAEEKNDLSAPPTILTEERKDVIRSMVDGELFFLLASTGTSPEEREFAQQTLDARHQEQPAAEEEKDQPELLITLNQITTNEEEEQHEAEAPPVEEKNEGHGEEEAPPVVVAVPLLTGTYRPALADEDVVRLYCEERDKLHFFFNNPFTMEQLNMLRNSGSVSDLYFQVIEFLIVLKEQNRRPCSNSRSFIHTCCYDHGGDIKYQVEYIRITFIPVHELHEILMIPDLHKDVRIALERKIMYEEEDDYNWPADPPVVVKAEEPEPAPQPLLTDERKEELTNMPSANLLFFKDNLFLPPEEMIFIQNLLEARLQSPASSPKPFPPHEDAEDQPVASEDQPVASPSEEPAADSQPHLMILLNPDEAQFQSATVYSETMDALQLLELYFYKANAGIKLAQIFIDTPFTLNHLRMLRDSMMVSDLAKQLLDFLILLKNRNIVPTLHTSQFMPLLTDADTTRQEEYVTSNYLPIEDIDQLLLIPNLDSDVKALLDEKRRALKDLAPGSI